MHLKTCLDVKYKLPVLMVTEYIAWTGMPSQVRKYMFIGLLCKTLYFQHYNLPTTTSPSPLLAGIIPQVNIRTSCKVPVIRQAVDLSSVLPVVSDCLIMVPHNSSNNPTHRERETAFMSAHYTGGFLNVVVIQPITSSFIE